MKRFWISFLFILSFLSPIFGDTIELKNGQKFSGVIVDQETSKEVTYRYQGTNAPQTVASEQVREVEFDKPSVYIREGLRAFKKKDFQRAAGQFAKERSEKYKPYGRFYLGESHRMMRNWDEAISAYKTFETMEHRLAPEALYNLGVVYLEDRKFGEARQTFEKVISKKYSQFWEYMGMYGLGQALLKQKEFAQARKKFEEVVRKCRSKGEAAYQELHGLAEQGKGLALVGEKDYSKARRTFADIIKSKYATSEALAGSYLGMGKVYYAQAKSGRKAPENYKKALLCFLRVVMLYGGYKDMADESKKLAADCFDQLGQGKRAQALRNK